MSKFRYDKDLECLIEIRDDRNYFEASPGPHIMPDIQDYMTVAGDIANGGGRARITSRSHHRDFLRRNRYVEVGNDYDKKLVDEAQPMRVDRQWEKQQQRERVEDIKRAIDLCRSGEFRNIRFEGE
jgi:hypothetical protein